MKQTFGIALYWCMINLFFLIYAQINKINLDNPLFIFIFCLVYMIIILAGTIGNELKNRN